MKISKHPLVLAAVSAAIGVLGCLVVANMQPERRDLQRPLPHHLASSESSSRPRWRALFGSNGIPGNEVETLVNGNEIIPAMLRAMRAAANTITLETYIYRRGDIADQSANVLAEKARSGVNVEVLLDWVASLPMDEGLMQKTEGNFYDERLARRHIELFEADLKRSTPYTLSQWERRTDSEAV